VRFHTAEVPFAILKQIIGLRRFLLRGLEKVRTEWLWGCTAYNLAKLVRGIAALRAARAAVLGAAGMQAICGVQLVRHRISVTWTAAQPQSTRSQKLNRCDLHRG
jgi:hypothetical protein